MKLFVRFFCIVLVLSLVCTCVSAEGGGIETTAKSVILIDSATGEVLYEKNPDERLPIASVTKVMTMLLCMEAINSGKITMEDTVTASEYACSMGGSQVYLEPGEQMPVSDMIKAIAVASGNDASVAMAEHIMGSEQGFVAAEDLYVTVNGEPWRVSELMRNGNGYTFSASGVISGTLRPLKFRLRSSGFSSSSAAESVSIIRVSLMIRG